MAWFLLIPPTMTTARISVLMAFAVALSQSTSGCAAVHENAVHSDLRAVAADLRLDDNTAPSSELPTADTLNAHLAFAMRHSPELRAEYERWRSATLSISKARRLPDPMLGYGFFIQSVETRVGPQRHRVGLSQTFPWPTKLTAGADAAAAKAKASQKRFEAMLLSVKKRIADAYWKLWLIEEEHRLKSEHDVVLETLAGAIRGRVETGKASLADLNQIELNVARHHDHHGVHAQARASATAALYAAIGTTSRGTPIDIADSPDDGVPSPTDAQITQAALQHPRIDMHELLAEGSTHMARKEAAAYFPMLKLGFDFIETGPAAMPNVADSGKDPMIVSAAVSLPIWWPSYADAEDAAHAQAQAHTLDSESARQQQTALLTRALANVRDAQRRIDLFRHTLIPQAETTYQSVLGSYQSGRSAVAAMVLSQRDLLELQIELAAARAAHAQGWALLESVAGRTVERKDNSTESNQTSPGGSDD